MAKVTYLDNSGFVVKEDGLFLVFDYYHDPAHKLTKQLEGDPDAKVIFFVSSPHPDHFNKEIFNLAQNHERVYLTANQVVSRVGDTEENIGVLTAGDRIEDVLGTGTKVEAYGATEAGVSFLLTLKDGSKIFYGGCLAPYHLDEKGGEREEQRMKNEFRTIVDRVATENPAVQLAFLAVDPLTGPDYADGARYFVEKVDTQNFVPMHYHGNVDEACDFRTYGIPADVTTKFHGFRTVGQELEIKI